MIKSIASCAVFCLLLALLLFEAGDVIVKKDLNRYYMLEKKLEELDERYEVQIYGSCHAYTSFKPQFFTETYGMNCYNLSNPSEIIPVTYLRMLERFKTDKPKVALVETWGTNLYGTYIGFDDMQDYMQANMDRIPPSLEKLNVMRNIPLTRMLEENFAIAKYKDRLIEGQISTTDSAYSYEHLREEYYRAESSYYYEEMDLRFANNGYKPYSSNPLPDYESQQASVERGETMPVEADIMEYVNKIISLCEEYDVELIFYRAPYRSKKDELKKVNYLSAYFAEQGIPYYDLEQEIAFDPMVDFYDYEHLSEAGAQKATEFLSREIIRRLDEKGGVY